MTVQLEIRDGALPNWWLSPNIWTTFANDPSLPTQPIKGSLYYVWVQA